MTKQQAEHILTLASRPEWATFIALKRETLEMLHKELEWEDKGVQKIQGQIIEIRADLELQKRAMGLLSRS